ncbi:hypothetical protein A2354_03865 [Candidatus Amesbacteria bacterium RIFOXYB1_FULL_47_12]|nr:MAG: hypothetical protein A2354_03865 [Candidatus Amesbacteria bacterium RIFOXYB1_FULL_47_12]
MLKRIFFFVVAGLFVTLIFTHLASGVSASSDPVGPWIPVTVLPYALANHVSFASHANLYVIGGSTSFVRSDSIFSPITPKGEVTGWDTSILPHLATETFWHSVAKKDNNVYIIGGAIWPGGKVNSVGSIFVGHIGNDGIIPEWIQLGEFPDGVRLAQGAAAVVGNRLYFSGGGTWSGGGNPILSNKVYMAPINGDGSLGAWSTVRQLPTNLIGHSMIASKNRLVIIGGAVDTNWGGITRVISAQVNGDGSLGEWTDLPPLLQGVRAAMVAKTDDYVILAGGVSFDWRGVYYSPINTDGTLGVWSKSASSLPLSTCCASAAMWNSKMYITGRHDGVNYFDTVVMAEIGSASKLPIILVPGMGGSWNYEALVHKKNVANEDWSLFPFLTLYDGLIKSLEDAGYTKGKDLFIYAYDWRKSISENGVALCQFIDQFDKVKVVGHSMGGLVGRVCAQSSEGNRIEQLITVGSPHLGVSKVYRIWEGADFSEFAGWESIAVKIILGIWREGFDSSTQTIRSTVPSVLNLFPVWDFLKKGTKTVPISGMKWKNNFIPALNPGLPGILSRLSTVSGSELDTTRYYRIISRLPTDLILGKWEDGRPVGQENDSGDKTVLLNSSQMTGGTKNITIPGNDHGEILSKSAGQQQILQLLGLEQPGYDVIPVKWVKTVIVTVASPVDFSVTDPAGVRYDPRDGLVIVDEAPDGNYQVELTAIDPGKYTVHFGRVGDNDWAWETAEGRFEEPGQKKDWLFDVDFSQTSLGAKPLDSALARVNTLVKEIKISQLGKLKKTALLADLLTIELFTKNLKGRGVKITEVKTVFMLIDVSVNRMKSGWLGKGIREELKELIITQLRLTKADIEQELSDRGLW